MIISLIFIVVLNLAAFVVAWSIGRSWRDRRDESEMRRRIAKSEREQKLLTGRIARLSESLAQAKVKNSLLLAQTPPERIENLVRCSELRQRVYQLESSIAGYEQSIAQFYAGEAWRGVN